MSSHREAPAISKDPVADSADLYAFVSPDRADTVTIVATYNPSEGPAGGPTFYEFGDDVLYEIHIANSGDASASITYQFQFTTTIVNPKTFLYNTGPIKSLTDSNWNRPQIYAVTKVVNGKSTVLGSGLTCPPCNIGPRSTPNYETALATPAVHKLATGETVFAGQRDDPFYVHLGSIFDLADLRPFPTAGANGVNTNKGRNIHAIAIQVPASDLTSDGSKPTDPVSAKSVVGVWTSASRQEVRVLDPTTGKPSVVGPWVQVSRMANPLFNEVIVP